MQSLSLVLSLYLSVPRAAFASITIQDPSDVIDPQDWAADNALFADYDIAFIETQPSDRKSSSLPLSFVLKPARASIILTRGNYSSCCLRF